MCLKTISWFNYVHTQNIELLNITMFPGKDIEGIQVVIKKFSKVFTTIGLYSSPHTTVEQIHTFVDNMLSMQMINLL